MPKLTNQVIDGYALLKSTSCKGKGPVLLYLLNNLLHRTIGFPLSQREMTVFLSGFHVSFRTKSSQLGAYVDIFVRHIYEQLSGFIPKPNWIIVDVGANIGFYSLFQAKAVGPTGLVYAFEPAPDCYALLKKNVEQNNLSWVKCFPLALSSRKEKLAFHVAPHATSTAHLHYQFPDGSPQVFNNQKDGIAVESTTLDAFVQDHRIDRIDILKIDTEGAEADIVKGGLQYALPITQRVVMESHNTRYLVRDLLAPLGFELVYDYRDLHVVYFERA